MKIGFTGASGTGKSTLVDILLKKFPDHEKYNNIQRQLIKVLPNFPTSKKTNNITQTTITANIASELLNKEKIIMDRTLIDTFAYSEESKNVTITDDLINMFEDLIKLYDIIFYCPFGEFDLVCDGVREKDTEYHTKIDKLIQNYIKKYKNFTKIVKISGSIDERVETILKHIST